MILRALYDVYDRLKQDPSYKIPVSGYSNQKVVLEVVFDEEEGIERLKPRCLSGEKNKMVPREMSLPGSAKPPGSGLNPCFLWDNFAYALGFVKEGDKPERVRESFEAFCQKHWDLEQEIDCPEYSDFCSFLRVYQNQELSEEDKTKLAKLKTGFVVFRQVGQSSFLHENAKVREYWEKLQQKSKGAGEEVLCLISGERGEVALVHDPAIKGVRDAQSSGAKIVSFNCKAFESYGKEQGKNAPASKEAVSRYALALNALLDAEKHRTFLGDATTVFWAEKPLMMEEAFGALCSGSLEKKEEQEAQNQEKGEFMREGREKELKAFYSSLLSKGAQALPDEEKNCPFYVLGISPNVSRLSIRFWYESTVGKIAENLKKFQEELSIVGRDTEISPISLWLLLRQTAREPKDILPVLSRGLMETVLTGRNYPMALMGALLLRIRAEQEVTTLKAALLKAFLIRNHKHSLTMSLDTENRQVPYLLGRLFALFERVQQKAINPKAGIRERFYSAASSTPAMVFPILMRNYQHHLTKLKSEGDQYWSREFVLLEVTSKLKSEVYPKYFSLEEQGLFSLGYYHQKQDFFKKKSEDNLTEDSSEETPN